MSDQGILLLFGAVIFAFVGPTLVGVLRQVEGLGELFMINAICLVIPPGLIFAWWMAFRLPRSIKHYEPQLPAHLLPPHNRGYVPLKYREPGE